MKKLLVIVGLILSSCAEASAPDPTPTPPVTIQDPIGEVKYFGSLNVTDGKLTDSNGQTVMLRGVSFGWHNWWPRFYNASAVKWLKSDWNANLVRAAMGVDPVGAYLENPAFAIEKIKAVVEAAIAEDMYVIIDWHSHELYPEQAKAFFVEMAQTYGDNPHVIYELFNEPDYETWEEVKAYSEDIIAAIRKYDPDNLILVGSPTWSQDIHIVAQNPILNQENIMYVLHFYAATHKDYLRDRAEKAFQEGLPIFVTECAGMGATGDGPIDAASWNAWLSWMESRKISWAAWSIADKNESCSMLLPQASSEGAWKDAQIKPWGEVVKKALGKNLE
ncbi:glycoside hydrolase family 5 protein [Algoriphagus sp. C2-6-M1]|uniref:glycoside hydrolase family 5 protein n=1 Tax=Algoriphagus persicinus TaxID=3108754 RepID=UPI002B39DFB8|nr:glycoside hydrolase family 5 protein [Algoriphagus sp. C2-6-M1]MEB2780109.1 glycoside hydrolase family 5 protein [Algoriphagus sp. C2-6-M1]